jgi:pilus assembly protein Flp/PilA
VSRRLTRRTARDRGSSAVEFSLMVAAMAAMILAVVLGVGRVVSDFLFHGCEQVSGPLSASGQCVAPTAPPAPAAGPGDGMGDPPVQPASSAGQGGDESRPAAVPNDLGTSDDM